MPTIAVNGTTIYYETHGTGVPIVFIHDHLSSHHLFEPQVEYFSKRVMVIVLDLRGNGLSGKMNVEVNRIVDVQCEDLNGLLQNLNIPKVILVGCSSGGVIAQKFASLYPDRVRAVVVIDHYFYRKMKNSKLWDMVDTCSWLTYYLPGEFFLRSLRAIYHRWQPAYFILRNELLRKRPTELIKQRMALRHIDPIVYSLRIQVPILYVAGSQNKTALVQLREVSSSLPHAQIAILNDAIYPSHLCQPLDFNQLLLNFLIDQQAV
ncbi:MAG: alpha/beta fold hydrolase [Candidatus Pristimantibacillus sp.]